MKLETQMQPANDGDFMAWWKATVEITVNRAYGNLSPAEADQQLASLGEMPEPKQPLPLCFEIIDQLHAIYGPYANLTQ